MPRLLIDVNSIVHGMVTGRVSGIGRTTLELVKALNKVPDIPFDITLYSQNMKGVGGRDLITNFKTKHFYLPNRKRFNQILSNIPLKELSTGYDLMHIPHNFEYVRAPEKTIFTLHDALFMKINETAFNHLNMRLEVPAMMKKSKGIITCSKASKDDIVETMQIDPDKVDVIYWGINHDIFRKSVDLTAILNYLKQDLNIFNPYFLSVSCNADRKNTHKLVEAYLLLAKHNPVNDLILVWSNPPAFVIDMIEKSGFKERIHFIGPVSDLELAMLYNGATAFIFPSLYEGFGLPILEAMACGCPVVTVNNSSLPEVGGEAVLYMDKSNTESIFKFLEDFENIFYDNLKLSEKGIVQASKFQWEHTAIEYTAIYKKHLGI